MTIFQTVANLRYVHTIKQIFTTSVPRLFKYPIYGQWGINIKSIKEITL